MEGWDKPSGRGSRLRSKIDGIEAGRPFFGHASASAVRVLSIIDTNDKHQLRVCGRSAPLVGIFLHYVLYFEIEHVRLLYACMYKNVKVNSQMLHAFVCLPYWSYLRPSMLTMLESRTTIASPSKLRMSTFSQVMFCGWHGMGWDRTYLHCITSGREQVVTYIAVCVGTVVDCLFPQTRKTLVAPIVPSLVTQDSDRGQRRALDAGSSAPPTPTINSGDFPHSVSYLGVDDRYARRS